MSTTPFASAFAAGAITPAKILDFHAAHFGDLRMEAAEGQRPEGVSEAEWEALGDPGKQALTRERERATKAEQQLAEARKPKPSPPAPAAPQAPATPAKTDPPATPATDSAPGDVQTIVQQAVAAAIAPFQQAEQQRQADAAAQRVVSAVQAAAGDRFHDPSDAVASIDLTALTDGAGQPDEAKVKAALDEVLTRKPHLAKLVDTRRRFDPAAPFGGVPSQQSADDAVKAALAKMQTSAGVKLAAS